MKEQLLDILLTLCFHQAVDMILFSAGPREGWRSTVRKFTVQVALILQPLSGNAKRRQFTPC